MDRRNGPESSFVMCSYRHFYRHYKYPQQNANKKYTAGQALQKKKKPLPTLPKTKESHRWPFLSDYDTGILCVCVVFYLTRPFMVIQKSQEVRCKSHIILLSICLIRGAWEASGGVSFPPNVTNTLAFEFCLLARTNHDRRNPLRKQPNPFPSSCTTCKETEN